jgi:hypothetical protein
MAFLWIKPPHSRPAAEPAPEREPGAFPERRNSLYYAPSFCAGVAQSVEQLIRNQ